MQIIYIVAELNRSSPSSQPGDISYIPTAYGTCALLPPSEPYLTGSIRVSGHYVENTGNTTLKFLEIFNSDVFQDVSLAQVSRSAQCLCCASSSDVGSPSLQWLALTPPALVKQHLQLSDATISRFNRTKGVVVGGPGANVSS